MLSSISCPVANHAALSSNTHYAIRTPAQSITYKKLNDIINTYAQTLQQQTHPLAFQADKTINTIAYIFASLRKNIPACLLSTRYQNQQIDQCLTQIRGKFVDPKKQDIPKKSAPSNTQWRPDQEATIMFSSGSTGRAKAIIHTIGNHYYSAVQSNHHIPLNTDDKWLLSLPLYHVGGISILWRCFLAGATVMIDDSSKDLAHIIDKYQISHISLVPTQLHRLMNKLPASSSLKAILIGGGPISSTLIEQSVNHKLPVYISYGLTEMSSQVATSPRINIPNDVNKVRALKHSQIKVKAGEIYVKGKTRFKGYLTNGAFQQPFDSDGWFATGDIGILDADQNLNIKGRKDNMFISGGENIYPEEIEQVLLNDQRISEAYIIPVNNAEFGERPVGFIRGKIAREDLKNICASQLERFKVPIELYKIPETDTFKISRYTLRSMLLNNPSLLEIY